MALLLWLLTALVPCLLGMGALYVLYGSRTAQEMSLADYILTGGMMVIGLAEAAHLTAAVLGWSFSRSAKVFAVGIVLCSVIAGIVAVIGWKRSGRKPKKLWKKSGVQSWQDSVFWAAFGGIVILQLISVVTMKSVYIMGDMTLESVNSFLASDRVYEINPLTGRIYEPAMPLRLRILCLPSLYGYLSGSFAVEPGMLVYAMIPAFVLLASYLAYGTLAKYLFPQDSRKRGLFMLFVALLFNFGDYLFGMDGFNVLHSGFRGVAIRGAVLLPYTISLMLRRKYRTVLLCVLAEACIVWTLYGMGACLFVAVAMYVLQFVLKKFFEKNGRGGDAICRNS